MFMNTLQKILMTLTGDTATLRAACNGDGPPPFA